MLNRIPPKKLCPFAAAQADQSNSDCLGDSCACYVHLVKPRTVTVFGRDYADPEFYYKYEGCGLVTLVPWELVERKPEAKSPEMKHAEEAYKSGNIADKWQAAYNVLHASNATIKDRYHGKGYTHSYWLYGEGKIYRQKLKETNK